MKIIFLVVLSTIMVSFSFGQKNIDQLKVGEPMPKEIKKGGYSEIPSSECSCKVFYIEYSKDYEGQFSQMKEINKTYGIHYQNDTIVAIIKITSRSNKVDALQTYIGLISSFMKNITNSTDKVLLAARQSKNGVVDGIYYFGYSYENKKKYKVTGVVENTIIEEIYLPNSNYKPKLVD